jgi:hypothetical protein
VNGNLIGMRAWIDLMGCVGLWALSKGIIGLAIYPFVNSIYESRLTLSFVRVYY